MSDIGFTGKAIIILNKPIDDEFQARFFCTIERATDVGVFITYEDDDEESHMVFVPYGNVRGIEKYEEPPAETPVGQTPQGQF